MKKITNHKIRVILKLILVWIVWNPTNYVLAQADLCEGVLNFLEELADNDDEDILSPELAHLQEMDTEDIQMQDIENIALSVLFRSSDSIVDDTRIDIESAGMTLWEDADDAIYYNSCILSVLDAYKSSSSSQYKLLLLSFLNFLKEPYGDSESQEEELVTDIGVEGSENLKYVAAAIGATLAIVARWRSPFVQKFIRRLFPNRRRYSRSDPQASREGEPSPRSRLRETAFIVGGGVGGSFAYTGIQKTWIEDLIDHGPRLNTEVLLNHILALESYNVGISACTLNEELKEAEEDQIPLYDFCRFKRRHEEISDVQRMMRQLRPRYNTTTSGGYLPPDLQNAVDNEKDKEEALANSLIERAISNYNHCSLGRDEINLEEITQPLLDESEDLLTSYGTSFSPEEASCPTPNSTGL